MIFFANIISLHVMRSCEAEWLIYHYIFMFRSLLILMKSVYQHYYISFNGKTRKLFILMSGIYGTDFIIAGDLLITYPTFSGRWDMKVKKETPPRAWF